MRTIAIIFCLLFFLVFAPGLTFSQEVAIAPIWNVGDKWNYSNFFGPFEVTGVMEQGYICVIRGISRETLIMDKETLNIVGVLENGKKLPYKGGLKRLFDFPMSPEKTPWKNNYIGRPRASSTTLYLKYWEQFKVLGWEDIKVEAGEFRALKIEYRQETYTQTGLQKGRVFFWYSPEAKNLIKGEYEKGDYWKAFLNWGLLSYSFSLSQK